MRTGQGLAWLRNAWWVCTALALTPMLGAHSVSDAFRSFHAFHTLLVVVVVVAVAAAAVPQHATTQCTERMQGRQLAAGRLTK